LYLSSTLNSYRVTPCREQSMPLIPCWMKPKTLDWHSRSPFFWLFLSLQCHFLPHDVGSGGDTYVLCTPCLVHTSGLYAALPFAWNNTTELSLCISSSYSSFKTPP
jgi:hypothetical protein